MINPDLPITKIEEDKLNRRSFAVSLAQTLLQYSFSTSFSVGLYGEWGSGKTSLLNMVIETIEKSNSNIVILKFNPWLCSDPKQLITQFFKQMAAAIKLKAPAMDHIWKLIDQYADVLDAAKLIPVAGTIFSALGKAIKQKASKEVSRHAADLQGMKNQIISKLTETNLKIIVTIDDIDRLTEEEIIAVFQLVKALADFPNTIYLLAFDYEVVVHALSRVQYGDGKKYLEKVIQVPFEMPSPSIASIHDALFSKLNIILGDIPDNRWDKAVWSELFQFGLKTYIRSMRDVARYTNVFSLKFELLKSETNPVDLLGLTCLQVFEPSVYSKIPLYKDVLCGKDSCYSYEKQKTEKEKVQDAINTLISDSNILVNAEVAKTILGILFPRIQHYVKMPYYIGRDYEHKTFVINNNIAVPACFDRYFSLTLEDEAIPTDVIKCLIYQAEESVFEEEMKRIYKEGKIIWLLEEIQAYADKMNAYPVSIERASLIIKCLTRQWSFFKVDDNDFLSVPFRWRLLFCVEPLLNIMELPARWACIRDVFEDQMVQLSTLALLLSEFERQHGRFTEKIADEERQLLSLSQVIELENIFRTRAITVLNSGKTLEEYGEWNFLWLLEQIDPEFVKNKKRKLVTDDLSLIKVISYCMSHGSALGRTVTKTWRINRKEIDEFINIEEAYQRVRKFAVSYTFLSLSEEEQMDIAAFIFAMENNENQNVMGDCITEETIQKMLTNLVRLSKTGE